jgi:Protein of unknown function (DUF2612)
MPAGYGYGRGGYGVGGYGVGAATGSGPVQYQPPSYYLNLLTSQYQTSPKLLAYLGGLLQGVDDVKQLFLQFLNAIDIDQAAGVLLDLRGQLLGQSRTVGFQPSNGVSPVLDDATYRILLKARIAQNHWNGQVGSLQAIWKNLFPGGQISLIDQQNMTCVVIVGGAFTSIIEDLILNGYIVPRPQAVKYQFTISGTPIFGFDQNNQYVAGFDVGHWT